MLVKEIFQNSDEKFREKKLREIMAQRGLLEEEKSRKGVNKKETE